MAKNKDKIDEMVRQSTSIGIRQIESVRWVVEKYLHDWNDKGELISTKIMKTGDPANWSRAFEAFKLWSASDIATGNKVKF